MADYDISPILGFQLPIKGNGALFDQNVIRNNFTKADTEAGSARGRLTTLESATLPTFGSDGARDAAFPNPIQGQRVWRTDKFFTEMYFSVYNLTTNPYGGKAAGWYPYGVQPTFHLWREGATIASSGGGVPFIHGGDSVRWTTDQGFPPATMNTALGYVKFPFIGDWQVDAQVTWETNVTPGQRNLTLNAGSGVTQQGVTQNFITGSQTGTTPAWQGVRARYSVTALDLGAGAGSTAGGLNANITQNSGSNMTAKYALTLRYLGPGTPDQVLA